MSRETLGQQIKVRIAKNKIAPPFRIATLDLYYGYGVDRVMELISVAKQLGVLNGSAWLTLCNPITGEIILDSEGNEYKFHGQNRAREFLTEDVSEHGGKVYGLIFDLIQEVVRGEGECA